MTDIKQPTPPRRDKGKIPPHIHRIRLKEGMHVDFYPNRDDSGNVIYPVTGETFMFSKGDVFLSQRPLYKRDPNKYEFVDDHVPLTSGGKMLSEDYDPDFDEDPNTVPTVPVNPAARTAQQPYQVPLAKQVKEIYDPQLLEAMTVNELKSLAQAEEIDLGTLTKKPEIIAAIKKAKG